MNPIMDDKDDKQEVRVRKRKKERKDEDTMKTRGGRNC